MKTNLTLSLFALSLSACGTIQKASDKAEALDREGQAEVDNIPSSSSKEGSGRPGVTLSRESATKQIGKDPTRARQFQTVSVPGCEVLQASFHEGKQGLALYAMARCDGRVRLERLEQLASRDAYRFGNQSTVSRCEARSDVLSFGSHRDGRVVYACSEGDRVSVRLHDEQESAVLVSLPELRPLLLTEDFVVVSAQAFETNGVQVLSTNRLSVEPKAIAQQAKRLTVLSDARCETLAGGTIERSSFEVFSPDSEQDLYSLGDVSVGFSVNHAGFRVFDLDGCKASGLSARLAPTKVPESIVAHSPTHVVYQAGKEMVLLSYAGEELTLGESASAGLIEGKQPFAVVGGQVRIFE
ncbi:MAG: hypothetical protein ACRCXD_15030 [Luteolibacter sp.]